MDHGDATTEEELIILPSYRWPPKPLGTTPSRPPPPRVPTAT